MSTIEDRTSEARPGWAELLSGRNAVYSIILAGGVTLHALNIYIVTTILPSVVGDIGGLSDPGGAEGASSAALLLFGALLLAPALGLVSVGRLAGCPNPAIAAEAQGNQSTFRKRGLLTAQPTPEPLHSGNAKVGYGSRRVS